MSRFYYDDLKTDYRTDYLERSPRKTEALNSASVEGKVTVLPNSGNRAITIETDDDIYLQSYDTLILRKEKQTGKVHKLWNDYTATTMKHINTFLELSKSMGKHEWESYKCGETIRTI